ncbi:MAG: type II toxin-antitoxin system VapC family toxin [Candidatus Promineofilum sp.]|nr:type II toxin-antitoxin system VapC family toxin [Promineifilum sp.]
MEDALAKAAGATLVTSRLVDLEVLVKPLQEGREETAALYRQFLSATRQLPITDTTFDQALSLRVAYRLKTPDALHLALARQYGCERFWTNDERLARAAIGLQIDVLV